MSTLNSNTLPMKVFSKFQLLAVKKLTSLLRLMFKLKFWVRIYHDVFAVIVILEILRVTIKFLRMILI